MKTYKEIEGEEFPRRNNCRSRIVRCNSSLELKEEV